MERPKNLAKETKKREEDLALLESTEGYSLLTNGQRRIIRATLYIQARANRVKKSPWYGPYRESHGHIAKRNCHASIASVEAEDIPSVDPDRISKDFFDARYYNTESLGEIKRKIEEFGFPCVVHASSECGNANGEDTKDHSFLILGHSNGNIIVWDKEGYDWPYRVATIENEYSEYGGKKYWWGIRKLREID